jgi:hypothetical protein
MTSNFDENLIKGKITETIFEEMFAEVGEFIVLPAGYEFKTPELAQELRKIERKDILENLRHSPDFILLSENPNRKDAFLVEVKYRTNISTEEIKRISEELVNRYGTVCLFVASHDNFYFDYCRDVIKNNGVIQTLAETWVRKELQQKYLRLLNEFISK